MKTRRITSTLGVEVLEARTLLSVSPLGLGHSHETEHHGHGLGKDNGDGQEIHVQHRSETTAITDLTGHAANITQVLTLPSPGLPHALRCASGEQEVATLTSAATPVKLRGYTVMIDWGDGTTARKGKLKVDKSGVVHVLGSHAYAAEGTYTITITVTQHLPKSDSDPSTPDPTLTILSSASVAQNSSTGLTITPTTGVEFTGPVGSFTSTASTDPNAFTAIISWGDKARSLGTVTVNPDGSFAVGGTHTYAAAGTYRVTILVYQHVNPTLTHGEGDDEDSGNGHDECGWHLGWRKQGFTTISSTAIVADAPPVATP